MGVLRYFRWLTQTYGDFYTSHNKKFSLQRNPDMFLVDCNAIFHPAFREIFFPEQKRLLRPGPVLTLEEKVEASIVNVCNKIDEMIRFVKPRKCVYLAVDGVAGCCKQSQQRKRRFKTAKDNAEKDMSNTFDFTSLTAGTELMFTLCERLKTYFQSRQNPYTVVINDVSIVGEGEHKLIRCIAREKVYRSFCIYSPDADLIMLSLTLCKKGITILRENVYDDIKGDFILVNVDTLWKRMVQDLDGNDAPNRVIIDAVLFLFMLGNDFLPNVPAVDIAYEGISALYKYYVDIRKDQGFLCNEDKQLHQPAVVSLFKVLGEAEPALLLKKWIKSKSQWPDTVLRDSIVVGDTPQNQTIDLQRYKQGYYSRNFPEGTTVESICEEYVKGMSFVMQYYAVGIPTFDWFYPYHYAPLFSDLYTWCSNQPNLEFKFKFKKALSLTEALVSVLPPSSFHLLPEKMRDHMITLALIDPDFPKDFKVDLEGKIMDYEGVCLLPMITYDKVKQLCKKFKCKDTEGRLFVI